MANNKISLNIAGLNILISTPEDEEYVAQIAKEIDDSVNAILEKSSSASVTNAILLCTIDYLDSYKKANRTSNNMRNQIKDYMAEAANAKREFDEEKKHSEELEAEIQTLRNHLTRIATEGDASGVFAKMREDLNVANNELARQRKRNADLTAQNRTLTEKNEAMNSYIAGQDREIARLSAVAEELNTRLIDKTDLISELSDKLTGYESRVSELLGETDHLRAELDKLAELIDESHARQEKAAADLEMLMDCPVAESIAAPDEQEIVPAPDISAFAPVSEPESQPGPEAEKPKPSIKIEFEPEDNPSAILQTDFDDVNPTTDLETDIAAAISLVDDKKDTFAGRSMKNYDIDISDLPSSKRTPKHSAGKSGDGFGDFAIEEAENIVGFESLRRQIDDARVGSAAQEEKDVELKQPVEEKQPAPEKPKVTVEEAKPKNNLLREDDDAMPNLSWTLDV
jgi:Predicted membrane protein